MLFHVETTIVLISLYDNLGVHTVQCNASGICTLYKKIFLEMKIRIMGILLLRTIEIDLYFTYLYTD